MCIAAPFLMISILTWYVNISTVSFEQKRNLLILSGWYKQEQIKTGLKGFVAEQIFLVMFAMFSIY